MLCYAIWNTKNNLPYVQVVSVILEAWGLWLIARGGRQANTQKR